MDIIKRALISVSDKTGLVEFARGLGEFGVEIVSTGGTAKLLGDAGLKVRNISDLTGFPEMMDGRVKTLHPRVHGALLALRDNAEHMKAAAEHGIELIDLVVVNLYPFQQTVAKPGVTLEEAIENIDIGGPSMLRSAAKNYRSVAVICNPARYPALIEELRANRGALGDDTRASLAVEVFAHTSAYDQAIYGYLGEHAVAQAPQEALPRQLSRRWERAMALRYGENPHQQAAFYRDAEGEPRGLAAFEQLGGKELSFNNLLDTEAALAVVREFAEPAACIIKHNTPCGVATAAALPQAISDAFDSDPLSAFGGILAVNRPLDKAAAEMIQKRSKEIGFTEVIIAPSLAADALELLRQKKDLRLLALPDLGAAGAGDLDFKKVSGGLLVQGRDLATTPPELKQVARPATEQEMKALLFAWTVVKHVKSNAIVLAHGTKTVGIGGGQTSRVDSVHLAVRHAGERAKGSVLASDAFFPKPDGVELAAQAGVTAIIQPGGSLGDEECIAVAKQHNVAMVMTGQRHFKH